MKKLKLKLNLDDLRVESFAVMPESPVGDGTVEGYYPTGPCVCDSECPQCEGGTGPGGTGEGESCQGTCPGNCPGPTQGITCPNTCGFGWTCDGTCVVTCSPCTF